MTPGLYERMMRAAADSGAPVEAGWLVLCELLLPPNTTPAQADTLRRVYFIGAEHLFALLMGMMEEGREVTENDLRRVSVMHAELARFVDEERAAGPMRI